MPLQPAACDLRRHEQLAALRELVGTLSTSLPLPVLLPLLTNLTLLTSTALGSWVMLVEGEWLRTRAIRGATVAPLSSAACLWGTGAAVSQAALGREALVVPAAACASDPVLAPLADVPGTVVLVPIVAEATLLGLLGVVLAPEVEADLPVLTILAEQAAEALAATRADQVSTDMSAQKAAEQALRQSEARFRQFAATVSDIFWISDPQQRRLHYISPAYEQIMGRSTETLYANFMEWIEAIHPEDRPRVEAAFFSQVATGGYDEEFRIIRPDGSLRWLRDRSFPMHDEAGAFTGVAGIAEDITERKHAEQAVHAHKARLDAALASMTDAVLICDAEGRIVEFNEAFATINKFKDKDECAKTFAENPVILDVFLDTGELVPLELLPVPRALRGETGTNVEYALRRKDTGERWVSSCSFAPIRDQAGAIVGSVLVGRDITARKQIEQERDAALTLLDTLLMTAPIGVAFLDLELRFQQINERLAKINGLPVAAHLGRTLREVLPRLAEIIEPHYQRVITTGEPLHDWELHGKPAAQPGAELYALVTIFPVPSRDGQILGVGVIITDITARKRTEAAFQASEARLAAFLEYAPGAVFIKDAAGRYLIVNRDFLVNAEKRADEVLNKTDAEIFPPELADRFEAEDHKVRTNGTYHVFDETFTYHGRPYTFLTHKFPLPDGSIGSVGVNLTERKAAEDALRDLQAQRLADEQQYAARLQQLNLASLAINAAPTRDEVLRLTAEHARVLIGAHQALTRLTTNQHGTQAGSAVALSAKYVPWQHDEMPPDVLGLYALVCQTNQPMHLTQLELEAHPAWHGGGAEGDKHPPLCGWLAVPLIGRAGHNLGLIQLSDKIEGEFTASDEALLVQLAQIVTIALENQHLYAQEQQARAQAEEASRLKDEFLATVSHELRTPLTAFLGYAELLLRRKHDEAYVTRTIRKMVESAKTQAVLIEDLLDVARIVSGKLRIEPQPMKLSDVIYAALDTVRPTIEAKQLVLQVELDPVANVVIGDEHRLQQVVWNLLANAAKFTPSGGQIVVRLASVGRNAELRVSDTGQGIRAEFLPHLFERFRQADSSSQRTYGGLGLGLAIVRHLVELHGGTVAATSAGVGQGATFTVQLPLAGAYNPAGSPAPIAGDAPAAEARPSPLHGLRVLVVDDQPSIRELLTEILVADGAVVEVCATAPAALALVRTWHPDVLVSDIAMPNEDGYWLIEQVRSLTSEEGRMTPAVALTAYVRIDDRLRVLAAGFEQYVPKPVNAIELRDVIAQLAGTRRGQQNLDHYAG